MTSNVGNSHLLEFAFWALWVAAVLRNTLSKDPKTRGQGQGSGWGGLVMDRAGPGVQKNFDPEHQLARDSKGRSLALVLYSIQFVWCPPSLALCITHPLPIPRGPPCPMHAHVYVCECRGVCVFYYCRTYYKAVRVGGGGKWRTCAMRDDEPRTVWMSLPITH
jgi:hypothetical protein